MTVRWKKKLKMRLFDIQQIAVWKLNRMSHEPKKKKIFKKFGQQRTTEQKFNAPNSACLEIKMCVYI